MSEQSIIAVNSSVMLYDDSNKKWMHCGASPGISRVQVLHHSTHNSFRIVGRKIQGHEVVLNCCIPKNMIYNIATPTFHQWRDNRQVYGLNFSNVEEAENFSNTVFGALNTLITATTAALLSPSTGNAPAPQENGYQALGHNRNQSLGSVPQYASPLQSVYNGTCNGEEAMAAGHKAEYQPRYYTQETNGWSDTGKKYAASENHSNNGNATVHLTTHYGHGGVSNNTSDYSTAYNGVATQPNTNYVRHSPNPSPQQYEANPNVPYNPTNNHNSNSNNSSFQSSPGMGNCSPRLRRNYSSGATTCATSGGGGGDNFSLNYGEDCREQQQLPYRSGNGVPACQVPNAAPRIEDNFVGGRLTATVGNRIPPPPPLPKNEAGNSLIGSIANARLKKASLVTSTGAVNLATTPQVNGSNGGNTTPTPPSTTHKMMQEMMATLARREQRLKHKEIPTASSFGTGIVVKQESGLGENDPENGLPKLNATADNYEVNTNGGGGGVIGNNGANSIAKPIKNGLGGCQTALAVGALAGTPSQSATMQKSQQPAQKNSNTLSSATSSSSFSSIQSADSGSSYTGAPESHHPSVPTQAAPSNGSFNTLTMNGTANASTNHQQASNIMGGSSPLVKKKCETNLTPPQDNTFVWEFMKQEILSEMRREFQILKQDILNEIRKR